MNEVTPGFLRYASDLRGPTKTGMISRALSGAAALIEKMEAEHKAQLADVAGIIELLGKHSTDQTEEIERLRAAGADVIRYLDLFGKAVPLPEPMYNALAHLRAVCEQKAP